MEFCDKCGGSVVPHKKSGKVELVCRMCGKTKITTKKVDFKLSSGTVSKIKKVVAVGKKMKDEAFPKTKVQCPGCENTEAFWWMQQTRAGDEPPTRFHKCTKCGYTWREYD